LSFGQGRHAAATAGRPVLLVAIQKLVYGFPYQPRNWDILPNGKFPQLLNLFGLESYGSEFLSHV
jgi:hypothetical protein